MDPIQEVVEKMCNSVAQEVSYKLGDLIVSYPRFLRPVVVATVQACINSQLGTMPEEDRKLYDKALAGMEVVSVPREFDPRKKGGGNNVS